MDQNLKDENLKRYELHKNKGYGTKQHYNEISQHGITKIHRESFNLNKQLTLFE